MLMRLVLGINIHLLWRKMPKEFDKRKKDVQAHECN